MILADHVLGSSILTTVEQMQKTEEEKLAKTESIAIPRNVTIDENQEINRIRLLLSLLCRRECRL